HLPDKPQQRCPKIEVDQPRGGFLVQLRAVVNQQMNFIFLKCKQQREQRPKRKKDRNAYEEWSRAVHEISRVPGAFGWISSVATVHCDTSLVCRRPHWSLPDGRRSQKTHY